MVIQVLHVLNFVLIIVTFVMVVYVINVNLHILWEIMENVNRWDYFVLVEVIIVVVINVKMELLCRGKNVCLMLLLMG